MGTCSLMAMEVFPLSFWRNVAADTARALFGTIFFIVEITKRYKAKNTFVNESDFWRAIRERHPFALAISRGPQSGPQHVRSLPHKYIAQNIAWRSGPSAIKLLPTLPSRIRLPFPSRGPSQSVLPAIYNRPPTLTTQVALEHPDVNTLNDLSTMNHYHTFPRLYPLSSPVYLHTPDWELSGNASSPSRSSETMSLPIISNPSLAMNSTTLIHGPLNSSSAATPTRSLVSIATDSFVLEVRVDRVDQI